MGSSCAGKAGSNSVARTTRTPKGTRSSSFSTYVSFLVHAAFSARTAANMPAPATMILRGTQRASGFPAAGGGDPAAGGPGRGTSLGMMRAVAAGASLTMRAIATAGGGDPAAGGTGRGASLGMMPLTVRRRNCTCSSPTATSVPSTDRPEMRTAAPRPRANTDTPTRCAAPAAIRRQNAGAPQSRQNHRLSRLCWQIFTQGPCQGTRLLRAPCSLRLHVACMPLPENVGAAEILFFALLRCRRRLRGVPRRTRGTNGWTVSSLNPMRAWKRALVTSTRELETIPAGAVAPPPSRDEVEAQREAHRQQSAKVT